MPKAARHIGSLSGLALACLLSSTALAQTFGDVRVERSGATARIVLDYEDGIGDAAPSATAAVEHSVLIVRLSEALQADIASLADEIGPLAARARLDPDGATLRIALTAPVETRISNSYDQVAIDLAPPGTPALAPIVSPREQAEREAAARAAEIAANTPAGPPPIDPVPVQYRVGQTTEYTRLELIWPHAVPFELSQSGDIAELRFSEPAEISLGRLTGSPPNFLRSASQQREGNDWTLRLELEPGVQARAWVDGARVNIDLPDPAAADANALLAQMASLGTQANTPPGPQTIVPGADDSVPATPGDAVAGQGIDPVRQAVDAQPDDAGPSDIAPAEPVVPAATLDPVPENGIVAVSLAESNGDLRAEFPWAAPVGAAIFRRGDAIWIVFDAAAALQLGDFPRGPQAHIRDYEILQGDDYSALRLVASGVTQAEARIDGGRWIIVFSDQIDAPPRPIQIRRDARRDRPGRILIGLDGAHAIRWVPDPVVGDRIAVVTATGPVQGLVSRRDFVGGALLPSAHGGAVEVIAEDLELGLIGAGAAIGRPGGLDLTPAGGPVSASGANAAAMASPAMMHFAEWRGEGAFTPAWNARLRQSALEDSSESRIALARFLLARNMAPEALGMLDLAVDGEPQLGNDSGVRALQAVASYQMYRLDDAAGYLADPSLLLDPAADLWRGMVAVGQERWPDARRRLLAGQAVAGAYPPEWQARFAVAQARAALELGDIAAAQDYLYSVDAGEPDRRTRLDAAYIAARVEAEMGNLDEAIRRFENLAESGVPPLEAQALYELYRLKVADGRMPRDEAIDGLENLRFRWRGDTIELETVRLLGELYVQSGSFARGLQTMSTAQSRFPETEAARRIGEDMVAIFRRLFLDGEADRMDPVEAVAIFYQYQHLAPIGSDGDRMIRRLADRLIAFDLLGPASELLQHQVGCHRISEGSDCTYRLREPTARARVATDLAVVYLMDHRYEDALNTIRSSRVAGLPEALVDERYLLEARALSELGRHEQALELIQDDQSPAAARLRADVTWAQRDWPNTGHRLEALLGNRYQDAAPLTPSEQSDLVRAAIAYSMSGDRAAAGRLGRRYGEAMSITEVGAAFEVLTDDDIPPGNVRFSDLAARIASIDTLDAFMEPFRARFNNGGGPA
ncbi:tetratricopeptide repeat protein [Maricaulis sp.]|uniref:tetratricopeptide repeat protein n=1 Tax=Maricaulis sp. TaxID=1486257 RepID=UPI003A948D5D